MTILEEVEFQRWKEHPLTLEFLTLLRNRRDQLALAWARGRVAPNSLAEQAEAIILDRLAEINFDVLQELAGVEPAVRDEEALSDDDRV